MNFMCVDLEATCFLCKNIQYGRETEIIEIGACVINDDNRIISEFDRFVKPVKHPILSDFCKNLTSIKQSDVNAAGIFQDVLEEFKLFIKNNKIQWWGSWGNWDFNQFLLDCYKTQTIFPHLCHVNLKQEICDMKNTKAKGMNSLIKELGLTFDGVPHRGIDDTKNIVKIMKKLEIKPSNIVEYHISKISCLKEK